MMKSITHGDDHARIGADHLRGSERTARELGIDRSVGSKRSPSGSARTAPRSGSRSTAALAYVRAGAGATFVSLLPGHEIDVTRVKARDVGAHFEPSALHVIATKQRLASPIVGDVVAALSKYAR